MSLTVFIKVFQLNNLIFYNNRQKIFENFVKNAT